MIKYTINGEYALPAIIFSVGFLIGVFVLKEMNFTFFYQIFMREIVMWSCGRGFTDPLIKPQELIDFVFNLKPNFSCDVLPHVIETRPAGLFMRSHLYLATLVGLIWRLTGVAYANLWPLFGLLYGAYTLAGYAFARQFLTRWLAFAVGLLLALSPCAIGTLFFLRDFSKAPFFLGTLALLFFAMRATTLAGSMRACLAAGIVLGLGYGFRTDVLILVPIGAIMLMLGLPGTFNWYSRFRGVTSFLLATLLFAAPVMWLERGGGGGGGGAMIMEGSTDPFQRFMHLRPAPYSLGWKYSDELTLSSIAADLSPRLPNWNQDEGEATYRMSQSYTRSTRYFFSWADLFVADYATRALKSVLWVAGFQALVEPENLELDPGGAMLPRSRIGHWLEPLSSILQSRWAPFLGIVGITALLLQVYARSPRLTLAVAFAFISLFAYPAIQFSVRHLFYLEALQWVALFSIAVALFDYRKLRAAVPPFLGWLAVFSLIGATIYGGLRLYQNIALKAEIAQLLAGPRLPVPTRSHSGQTDFRIEIPVPERFQDIVSGPPDSMNRDLPLIGGAHRVQAGADRLLITLGSSCPAGQASVRFSYDKRPDVWQPLDHAIEVPLSGGPDASTMIIVPAFYRATQHLAAIELPIGYAECIERIEILPRGSSRLPIIFSAVLSKNWQNKQFNLGIGGF